MRNRLTKIMVAIAALGVMAVSPIAAQEAAPPAETPRCGGLLCDMGMFGGPGSEKTTLPCNDFVCRAFGGARQAEAAPPPVASPEPVPERKTVAKVRKQHVKVARKEAGSAPDATVPEKK